MTTATRIRASLLALLALGCSSMVNVAREPDSPDASFDAAAPDEPSADVTARPDASVAPDRASTDVAAEAALPPRDAPPTDVVRPTGTAVIAYEEEPGCCDIPAGAVEIYADGALFRSTCGGIAPGCTASRARLPGGSSDVAALLGGLRGAGLFGVAAGRFPPDAFDGVHTLTVRDGAGESTWSLADGRAEPAALRASMDLVEAALLRSVAE